MLSSLVTAPFVTWVKRSSALFASEAFFPPRGLVVGRSWFFSLGLCSYLRFPHLRHFDDDSIDDEEVQV